MQYGLPIHDFWHGEPYLLDVYQKAYFKNLYQKEWVAGQYTMTAMGVIMSGAFGKGSSQKYPTEPFDPYAHTEKHDKSVIEDMQKEKIASINDFIAKRYQNK